MSAVNLHNAIAAVAPIDGVSLADENDRTTWTVWFKPEATDAQKAAAQQVIAAFDPEAPTLDDYTVMIEAHVDSIAKSRNYTNGVSLASYKDSTNTQWAAEAAAFIAWRDSVWEYVYTLLAAVQAGQHAPPTVDDLIISLPAITWPA